MIKIEFLQDENGRQQVVDVVNELIQKALKDDDYKQLSHLVAQAFDYLKSVGVPPRSERLDGSPFTLANIVKELKHHPPLLELRANWRGAGAFRATFFFLDKDGEQYIYFTKGIIKEAKSSSAFNRLILESEKIMRDFISEELRR